MTDWTQAMPPEIDRDGVDPSYVPHMRPLHDTEARRFWSRIDMSDDCWIWTGETNRHGYGRFACRYRNKRTRYLAHRMMVATVLGRELGSREVVMHTCDTPGCVRYSHLRLGTQLDNLRDAKAKGRMNTDGLELSYTRRNPAKCGTTSGYKAHNRRGEKPCRPCWEANRVYQREYKQRRAA